MRPKRLVLGLLAAATLTACGASPDTSGTDETAVAATAATAADSGHSDDSADDDPHYGGNHDHRPAQLDPHHE